MRTDRLQRLADFLEPRDDWNLASWNTCAAGTAVKHRIFEADGLRMHAGMQYYPELRRGMNTLIGFVAVEAFFEITRAEAYKLFGGQFCTRDNEGAHRQLFLRMIRSMIVEHEEGQKTAPSLVDA